MPEKDKLNEEKQLNKEEQLKEEIARTNDAIEAMRQEIKAMKEEMQESRKKMKKRIKKAKDRSHRRPPFFSDYPPFSPPRHPVPPHPPRQIRPPHGYRSFWTDYISSILNSVAEGIEDAVGSIFIYDKPGRKKRIRKAIQVHPFQRFRRRGFGIPENQLDNFYKTTSKMLGDLADESRLKILRALEKGPKYQKELIEESGAKGGSFKHHCDRLIEQGFVTQEAVRGRYLITFKGREALKMAEVLYLRSYPMDTEEKAKKGAEIDLEIESNDGDDPEVDEYYEEEYNDDEAYGDNEEDYKEKKGFKIEIEGEEED